MFDKSLNVFDRGSSRVDMTVRIEEKRAPTDESVKLLREMEQAARDSVLLSATVGQDNELKALLTLNQNLFDMSYELHAKLKINDRPIDVSVSFRRTPTTTQQSTVEEIVVLIARKLAENVVMDALRTGAQSLIAGLK